jgi:ring-1,2-phenylacetyl-CoA epoxidase subunit PaaE
MSLKFHPLRVQAVIAETDKAFTVKFQNDDPETYQYLPGQYLTLKLDVDGQSVRRAYSLSSSPITDDHLSVTIKAVEGGLVSNYLKNTLKAGDTLEVLPPQGRFTVHVDEANEKHYVLIGGGSGITPLLSILKSVLVSEPRSFVTLVYANHNTESIIFAKQLDELTHEHHGRLTVYHVLGTPDPRVSPYSGMLEGRLAFDIFQKILTTDNLRKNFYLCGPNGLMENVIEVLEMVNVPESLIHRELYSAPPPDEKDDHEQEYEHITREVKVTIDGKTVMLTVTPDQTILDSAIAAKLDPPYACQEGVCCTCRAKVHSGIVSMRENEGLSEEELNAGFILTCQAHPLSAEVVVEFG